MSSPKPILSCLGPLFLPVSPCRQPSLDQQGVFVFFHFFSSEKNHFVVENRFLIVVLGDMLGGLKASTELFAEIDALVNKVDGLVSVLNQPFAPTGKPYPKLKDEVNELIRGVMSSGVALKTCDLTSIATIGVQAKALARTIPTLLNTARDAIATTQDPTAKEKLKSSIVSLIYATTGS